jgi:histidine triad (HIT) family protein
LKARVYKRISTNFALFVEKVLLFANTRVLRLALNNKIIQWRSKMKKQDCIFCKLANGDIPTNALYEDDVVKVIFDANPATAGHVLIIPKNHADDIYTLDDATAAHVFQVAVKVANALKEATNCDGLNIVQNNGEVAGQTVFHFHMHIIPRYKGDSVNVSWKPGKAEPEEIEKLKAAIAAKLA